ncbi:MAG TPA: ABC transporter ATP-binding protein [Eubacteriales bacterium]|nr:ABC transporter ATP-binding protein [Eubacteriales bacterium]
MPTPVVEIQHVSKYFAKVVANKDVSMHVDSGEVVALLGENGAGKSTIMKILYGLYTMDEGRILIRGEEAAIKSPAYAMERGIAMIQQHFSLVPTHTATENIILGSVKGHYSIKEYDKKIAKLAESYGFDIPVGRKVGELAVGVQQKIEILKALYINASILIMDEPTAVLTPQEAEVLMQFIRDFTAKGNSVIFITHKLREVMEVADRIVVMRNGVVAGTVLRAETNEHELAKMMIGQDIVPAERSVTLDYETAEKVLEFRHVVLRQKDAPPLIDDVSFAVHRGEIFGIAGVSGNGQDALCDAISGVRQATSGEIVYCGADISGYSIRERIAAGIGYVPVDRYRDGMVMDMTLAENMLLKSSFDKKWFSHGIVRQKALNAYTADKIAEHRVKATGPSDLAKSLSGGNQQKVVLAREVDLGKKLLVLNQPTRGLDMGAVDRIHKVILEEKESKKGVLLVSTELSEIFEICDRIAVMYKGKFMGVYKNGELTTAQIGLLMAGVSEAEEAAQ